jgi:exosortase
MNPAVENRGAKGWPALGCGLAGAAVFQFFGNAAFGYIKSASLFWWWGFQWVNPESETEHGLIILPLSIWLLWRNLRKEGSRTADGIHDSTTPAVAAMIAGLALHLAGFAAQQARVSIVALLLFTWGVLRLGGGRRWGAAALFPLGFLLLAIPVNALDSAGFWLRLWVIRASAGFAHAVGIGVFQNGTQLLAPDGRYSYDVAAACSGVRSLMALLALSLLLGYLNFRSWSYRATLVLLCFPLIYFGNVARITAIIFAGQWGGQAWGERVHDVMGFGVFVIVLGGELLAARWIERWWPEAAPGAAEMGEGKSKIVEKVILGGTSSDLPSPVSYLRARRVWAAAAIIVALAVGEMLFLAHLAALPPRGRVGVRLAADGIDPVELPVFLGTEWIGQRAEVTAAERAILPPDTGYSRKNYVAVADEAQRVFLSIVLSGRDRSSIHRPELCVVGQGWTIRAVTEFRFYGPRPGPAVIPATVLHVQREVRTPRGTVVVPQLIVYWFVGGDTIERTYWRRLVRDAWNRLFHARADRWAYVLMQTDARDGETAALARMQAVLSQTLPVFANGADMP